MLEGTTCGMKPIKRRQMNDMSLIALRRVLVERQINVSLNVVKISNGEVQSELTSSFSLPNR